MRGMRKGIVWDYPRTSETTMKDKTQPLTYGYARVSTTEQNLDRQLIALKAAGVPEANIFADKRSGKDFNRPAWKRLVRKLREGDVLVVKSIDRFGRSYDEIIFHNKTQEKEAYAKKGIKMLYKDELPIID